MEAEGLYFDGRTAQRHAVRVALTTKGLQIVGPDSVETWVYPSVRRRRDGNGPQLRREGETARLSVADAAFLAALVERCPSLDARAPIGIGRLRLAAIAGGALVVVAAGAGAVHVFPSVAARLVPPAWEDRIGRQAVEGIASLAGEGFAPAKTCVSALGLTAIEGMVGRLTESIELDREITITVLDAKEVNAFAAPGGHIVVLRGLIDFAESPGELAGTLAHEIGHVKHRHAAEGIFRHVNEARLIGLLTGNAAGANAASAAANAVIGASYSREAEGEADETGFALLGGARISAAGGAAFFERLVAENKSFKGTLLATHPPDQARADRARARAAEQRDTIPALTPDEWQAVKRICED